MLLIRAISSWCSAPSLSSMLPKPAVQSNLAGNLGNDEPAQLEHYYYKEDFDGKKTFPETLKGQRERLFEEMFTRVV